MEVPSAPDVDHQGSPEYGTDSKVVRKQYAWSSVDPSTAVVEAVAAALDTDPIDLKPLYDVVNPDALDALMRSSQRADGAGEATASFEFVDRQVTVRSSGTVTVRPAVDE